MPPQTRAYKKLRDKQTDDHKKGTWQEYLKRIYYDPKHPASFQGIDKLHNSVQDEKLFNISKQTIKQWLHNQHAYSLNKPVKRKFKRSRVIVKGIDDQFDADLIVVPKYAYANNGINYLLAVIDVFSRYAWVVPLKNKTGVLVKKAFQKIFAQGRKPRRIRTDRGSEFTNSVIKEFFQKQNVKVFHYFTNNELQANYAERFIKTFKSKIRRYMTKNVTDTYIDIVPDIVRSYNTTEHKGIKDAPENINEENEKKHWWEMYWPEKPYNSKLKKQFRRKVKFVFSIGDLVRISKVRATLQREYDERWTGEVFRIIGHYVRQGLPIYKLTDYEGEEMTGTYYQSELQKVTTPTDELFIVEEVLDKRTSNNKKQVLVKWKGWSKKFNRWVDEDRLEKP